MFFSHKPWSPARILLLFFASFVIASAADGLPPPTTEAVGYQRDVKPLFETKCYACHGEAQQMSGLRLDRKADALKGGHSGPAILPGNSAESRLIHLVAGYQVKVVMPPAGPALTPQEVGILRAWIDQGADWPEAVSEAPKTGQKDGSKHWSFQPIIRPGAPGIQQRDWARSEIDKFVLAKLESEGIRPSPEADKLTLLRRASLDLTGLPPTPQAVEAYRRDNRPDAYERVVDELLESPHYGEKWAMHWLDQVRYADSDGYEKDDPRPHAWRYREWVINALNDDMPFDRFSIEQIAGDLLPSPTTEQIVATGFHRNTLKNREGGVNVEQFRFEETIDRVSTIGTVWLGLTVGCAQCHDHKYDPIAQREFYQLYAFVNNIEEEFIHAPMPGELGPWLRTHDEYRLKRDELLCQYGVDRMQPPWEEKVKHHGENPGLDTAWDVNWDTLAKMSDGGDKFVYIPADKRSERQKDVVTDYFIRFYSQVVSGDEYKKLKFAELRKKLIDLQSSYPQLSEARVVSEKKDLRPTHIQVRGQWDRPGIEVIPAVPAVLPPIKASETPTRLDLARWLVSKDNPLTARVIVNRVWQEYFGNGIVSTSDDFGTQGERPSHPELLDWLADEFVNSSWSLKKLHRLIVTSAVYRQSSAAREDLRERDPANRLLARQSRLRLPAELVRDSALSAAGLLADKVGGPSVKPPIPDGITNLSFGSFEWETDQGANRYRRGLYIFFQRTVPYPFLMNFDATERVTTECGRERSNTPLQALNLLNDPVFFEAAQGLATRILVESPQKDFANRLDHGFQLCLSRDPKPNERQRLEQYFNDQMKLLDETARADRKWYPTRLEGVDRTEAAAWTGVARLLLNLDEFITRE